MNNKTPKIEIVCSENCDTNDIINGIKSADPKNDIRFAIENKNEANRLRQKHNNYEDLFYEVWKTLRNFIYIADGEHRQDVKSPNVLRMQKTGDCKSYSNYVATIAHNLGLKYFYRLTNYQDSDQQTAKHVYVVIVLSNKKQIIVDGVYHYFNKEKPYKYKKDMYIKAQTKNKINGLGDNDIRYQLSDIDFAMYVSYKSIIQKFGIGGFDAQARTAVKEPLAHQIAVKSLEKGVFHLFEKLKRPLTENEKKTVQNLNSFPYNKETKNIKEFRSQLKYGRDTSKALLEMLELENIGKTSICFLYLFVGNEKAKKENEAFQKRRIKQAELGKEIVSSLGCYDVDFKVFLRRNLRREFGKEPEIIFNHLKEVATYPTQTIKNLKKLRSNTIGAIVESIIAVITAVTSLLIGIKEIIEATNKNKSLQIVLEKNRKEVVPNIEADFPKKEAEAETEAETQAKSSILNIVFPLAIAGGAIYYIKQNN